MKILLINQFFYPDVSAAAQLATDLAEDLAAQGFEVTALAARGSYLGGQRLPREEVHRGVRIVRVPSTSLGKGSILRRMVDYGTFYLSAAFRALSGRYDAVVSMSTPPLIAVIGAARRVLRRTPFVYWLQDVYPELAIQFGVVRAGSMAARGFDALNRWMIRRADRVVVIGDAMAAIARAKGVHPDRIDIVPNWADGREVWPVAKEQNAFLREHGLADKRVVLYSGNIGRGHDIATIVGAARLLRSREDIAFVFIGEGVKRPEVEAAARELPSIRLLPYQPRSRLAESLSAGDVHLVTQEQNTLGLIEPCKLYGILAAGRPVLYVGPGEAEAARTITQERVGSVVANGNVEGAVTALQQLLASAHELGPRARDAFERSYDRSHRTSRIAEILRRVAR